MKKRHFSPIFTLPLVIALHGIAGAAPINKASTDPDLTAGASWAGTTPGLGDIATWVTGSLGGALTIGTAQSWQGMDIQAATAAITTSGAGTLTLGSSGINIAFAGQNLSIANNVTVGSTQNWSVGSGRTLTFSNTTAPTLTFNADVTLDGAGSVVFGGGNIALAGSGALIVNSGTLTNNMQAGSSSTRTGTTALSGGSIVISSSQNIFGSGAIHLNGGAVGSGTASGRSYSNSVNIGGNVRVGGTGFNSGTMTFSGPISMGGATRQIDSGITGGQGTIFSGAVSNGGLTLNSTGGTGILTLSNNTNSYTGATTVTSGYLAISNSAIANSSSISLAANTRLFVGVNGTTNINDLSGVSSASIRTDFTITGTTAARTLNINQTTDGTFAGTFIQGSSRPISLEKAGSATLTLSAGTGYTGTTTVTGGKLVVNGNISTSTQTTVKSGATLSGTGTVGTLAIESNGHLAPGNSAGTLSTGALSLVSGSILDFEFNPLDQSDGGGINDLLAVTGNVTLDGLFNLTATSGNFLGAIIGDTWTIATYTGTFTDNGLSFSTMPALSTGLSWTVDTATTGQITLAVVPEPGAALLGGLGMLALLRRRR